MLNEKIRANSWGLKRDRGYQRVRVQVTKPGGLGCLPCLSLSDSGCSPHLDPPLKMRGQDKGPNMPSGDARSGCVSEECHHQSPSRGSHSQTRCTSLLGGRSCPRSGSSFRTPCAWFPVVIPPCRPAGVWTRASLQAPPQAPPLRT